MEERQNPAALVISSSVLPGSVIKVQEVISESTPGLPEPGKQLEKQIKPLRREKRLRTILVAGRKVATHKVTLYGLLTVLIQIIVVILCKVFKINDIK